MRQFARCKIQICTEAVMSHPVFNILPEPKQDEREGVSSREKLLSASERLRVPTPSERLLQD